MDEDTEEWWKNYVRKCKEEMKNHRYTKIGLDRKIIFDHNGNVTPRVCTYCGESDEENYVWDGIIFICRCCGIQYEPKYWKDYQHYATWKEESDENGNG